MWIYFSAPCSFPLIHLSTLSIPFCVAYCSFTVSMEVSVSPSNFVVPLCIVLAIMGLLPLHINFRISLSIYPKSNLLVFLLQWLWTYKLSWEETDFFLTVLNLPIHEHGIFLYFFLCFYSNLCNIPHEDVAHILLHLYLFHTWGANVNGIVVFISNLLVHC